MSENQIVAVSTVSAGLIPLPPVAIRIRPGVPGDLPFIDQLQKKHTKMVGWMPMQQLEGKIKANQAIIAEDESHEPIGYCIGQDQYFKRDDVGIIYQMNVVPGKQRGLVGATLLKAMFDRAAWGCKLFCCWCAQDIEANYYWESMGFVPLAFRAGSRGKQRVHIFWQKRIRVGDTTTPYWFPSQTSSGSIREDRIVLPIPPGTHWKDAKPLILPGEPIDANKQLPAPRQTKPKTPKAPVMKDGVVKVGGLRFGAAPKELVVEVKAEEAKPKKQKTKNNPKLVAAARELRDRWLEHANAHPEAILPSGKYDVSRALTGSVMEPKDVKLLAA